MSGEGRGRAGRGRKSEKTYAWAEEYLKWIHYQVFWRITCNYIFFLFVLFLLCVSWSSAIPIVLSVGFIWRLGSTKGLGVVLAMSWKILPRKWIEHFFDYSSTGCLININPSTVRLNYCQKKADRLRINDMLHKLEMNYQQNVQSRDQEQTWFVPQTSWTCHLCQTWAQTYAQNKSNPPSHKHTFCSSCTRIWHLDPFFFRICKCWNSKIVSDAR